MTAFLAAACALCVQTIVGGVACALLARFDDRLAACWHALRVRVILAVGVGSVALLAGWLAGIDSRWLVEPVRALLPGIYTATGALVATGGHLVLHAGRVEAAGGPALPVALPRGGGKIMFLGADLSILAIAGSVLLPASPLRSAVVEGGTVAFVALLAGGAACVVGGFAGLLAGISGKPRPSGPVAAALYVTGMVLIASAAR